MFMTVALVVLGFSIAVFFSQEFAGIIKKLFALPGVKLLLPLILVTTLVVYYEDFILIALQGLKTGLHAITEWLASCLPFEKFAVELCEIILLMLFAVFPVVMINFWMLKKTYKSFEYSYLTITIIWLIIAILFTVSTSY